MEAGQTYAPDLMSKVAEIAPVLRGALAAPTGVEGRYRHVVLKFSEGDSVGAVAVPSGGLEGISKAIADNSGAKIFSVPQVGSFSTAEPQAGDLSGQVAVVTGGAGGLGFAVAEELRSQGAEIAILDIAEDAASEAAQGLGGIGLACDVTSPDAVDQAINRIVAHFGGIDILVSNAGSALQGSLLELDDAQFQKAFALNFWGHHYVARSVVRVMKKQGTGGALVFNVSKQAVNPGPNFAAYGTPKAALMALMRQYAVEHGADGITSNAVNADRIRTGLMTDKMVEERSKARGLTPEQYMRGNLIKREVTGKDVAEAFVYLAKARTSTGAVLTVDGGNVAAMMR